MSDADGGRPDGADTAASGPEGVGTVVNRADPEDAAPVTQRLAAVEQALTAVLSRLEAEAERAAARERVIDHQHAEIERLRAGERGDALRPVVTDLCRLRNDLRRQSTCIPADVTPGRVAALLESYAASVEEALLRCGVEVLPDGVGAPVAPRRQQVVRIVAVDDPELDGTVAEVIQDGYAEIDGGRVVMAARVAVLRADARDADATKEHVDA